LRTRVAYEDDGVCFLVLKNALLCPKHNTHTHTHTLLQRFFTLSKRKKQLFLTGIFHFFPFNSNYYYFNIFLFFDSTKFCLRVIKLKLEFPVLREVVSVKTFWDRNPFRYKSNSNTNGYAWIKMKMEKNMVGTDFF